MTTVDASLRNRTAFKVNFPGSPVTNTPVIKGIKVIQKPCAHDIAVFSSSSVDEFRGLIPGAPVAIDWTGSRGSESFRGYLYRMDPAFQANNTITTTFICVGSSYPLMNKENSVWSDVSASDVVKAVALKFGLNHDVEQHPRVYNTIAQAGDSYWQLLVRLADETGYVLRVEGSTVMFRSRDSVMGHYRPIAPVLQYKRSNNVSIQNYTDILSFKVMTGEFTPELGTTRAVRTAYGTDPTTGTVLSKSVGDADPYRTDLDPVFNEVLTDAVINTQMELDTALNAAQERNRFSRVAKMTSWGDAYIAPERVLYIDGGQDFSGYWTVRTVTHSISALDYRCEVTLGTDGLGATQRLVGEPMGDLSTRSIPINPHRPGGLAWPYPEALLASTVSVSGIPGQALTDFSWVAPTRDWSVA